MANHLLGMKEAAALLGVTKQRLGQLLATNDDFPAPTAELSQGRVWNRADVERWAKEHGRRTTGA